MAVRNLTKIRAKIGEMRRSLKQAEEYLGKFTPEEIRGDVEMMLERASQDLAWAVASLRKSEIDVDMRRQAFTAAGRDD